MIVPGMLLECVDRYVTYDDDTSPGGYAYPGSIAIVVCRWVMTFHARPYKALKVIARDRVINILEVNVLTVVNARHKPYPTCWRVLE